MREILVFSGRLNFINKISAGVKTNDEKNKKISKKKLILNAEKSKVLIFKKGKNKKEKEKWKWGQEKIEEVKDFKYLGYFQKNRETKKHIRETFKKALIAMKQTWGIRQRRFKNNFERRMKKMFNSLVKSIMK